MNIKLYLPVLISIFLFALSACTDRCKNSSDIHYPPFTEDELKWVKFEDSLPKFKHTNTQNETDTVQGAYTGFVLRHPTFASGDECYVVTFYEAKVDFHFPSLKPDFFRTYINMGNDAAYIKINVNGANLKITKEYLDTAFVNGKLYQNVLKFRYGTTDYYLVNGIGFIYIKQEFTFDNSKIIETAELIPQ